MHTNALPSLLDKQFNYNVHIIHQVPLVDPLLRLASCVLQVNTVTSKEWLSQVAPVQKATTVLRDRSLKDHSNMPAQLVITVRRSAV